jgi:cell division transport system permease protein
MLGWLFASPAERRLLPGGRFRGPTPFVIAIMTFAMMTVAAAGLALSNAASLVVQGIENRYAVQVPAGSKLLPRALAAANSAPGVLKAEPVPEAEMRRTLERWLGPAGVDDQLPVPALITLDVADDANLAAIAARVEKAAPDARFIAHREKLEPVLRAIRVLKWLALALVALMAAATSAAVVLAARGALDTHRSTIEVMHGIGATDLQVTHLFQRKIALDSLAGAVAGAIAAGLVLLLLAGGGAAFAGDLMGTTPLRGTDLVILALLPFALVVIATWVARAAVLASLRSAT